MMTIQTVENFGRNRSLVDDNPAFTAKYEEIRMAINLQKGQRISLEKEAGRGLNRVVMGLGWGMKQVQSKGFLGIGAGSRQKAVDLDASCLLFDAAGALIDTVWFRQLASHCGSIQHSGDDRSGGGETGTENERISLELGRIPTAAQTLVFTVNSFSGESFTGIPNAFCRLVDEAGGEIARFDLTLEGGDYTGLIMSKLYRHNSEWKMQAIGEHAEGRTFHDLLPALKPYL